MCTQFETMVVCQLSGAACVGHQVMDQQEPVTQITDALEIQHAHATSKNACCYSGTQRSGKKAELPRGQRPAAAQHVLTFFMSVQALLEYVRGSRLRVFSPKAHHRQRCQYVMAFFAPMMWTLPDQLFLQRFARFTLYR
jgi:hypothetical protein